MKAGLGEPDRSLLRLGVFRKGAVHSTAAALSPAVGAVLRDFARSPASVVDGSGLGIAVCPQAFMGTSLSWFEFQCAAKQN